MILNFNWSESSSKANFFTNKTNRFIINWIENDNLWNGQTILVGPKKSGKTHLANIWKEISGGFFLDPECSNIDYSKNIIIDNVNRFSEEKIFNILFNSSQSNGNILWLIEDLNFIDNLIPDIRSRFNVITHMQIPNPDNEICIAIMHKLFRDFGLDAHNDVLQFIIKRVKRSYDEIYNAVSRIHTQCIIHKRAPSVIFVSSIFETSLN
ncbi:hypothetical protein FZC35_02425 [Candidatus Cytomitobacter indipagum]|uniref:Uncharacterized protein n=1 Tax=Candidatus Cytomitobacter indipagum TaxID=2601575 RepID=A0A5C0UES8_9PROT|nr:DnaA/Hda family protein [Candidatus Cytomitobacter indipagum]QEK38210.1 hypothetical protein FZC35_02425 [Candidatus Cytomitobacter indipagum]